MEATPALPQRRIVLLGADGQLGWELRRALLPLGEVIALGRAQADLGRDTSLRELLERLRPAVIVNAAAYTAVDRAQDEAELAYRVNAQGPAVLAAYAAASGAWLLHYSTDYVFDGSGTRAWREDDAPNPLSVYGRTKLQGEQAVRASGCQHLILRTSWVFAARGGNFAKTMVRLARERDALRVVADQVGAPTSAELIADLSALALHRLLREPAFARAGGGLYHLSSGGSTSWHGYACHVLRHVARRGMSLRCDPSRVQAIATAEYPLPAPRPANSRLDCAALRDWLGVCLPPWQPQVERMLDEAFDLREGASEAGEPAIRTAGSRS